MTVDAQDSTPAPPADRRGAELETGGVGEQSEQPKNKSNGDGNAPAETGQKPNPKDPSRPRRKKARRACFACQRAHLTCGTLDCLLFSFVRMVSLSPLPSLSCAVAQPMYSCM